MYEKCVALLSERGVELTDIAQCVLYLQSKYHPDVKEDEILAVIQNVIRKREVQHAILRVSPSIS